MEHDQKSGPRGRLPRVLGLFDARQLVRESEHGGDSTLETWIALTFLAGKTEYLRLGTIVTPIPFRPPGMLAKQVSTLDLASGGRVILGVGAGWSQTEFEGYSEWNEPKIRVDKTLEGLELILKLWTTGGRVSHHGQYFNAKGATLEPKPVQKPYPPLLFGGVGKRMLGMAGRYADICCIPAFSEIGSEKSKEIVLKSARKYSREDKLSFAQISWGFSAKYHSVEVAKKVSDSKRQGCDYLIVGFPRETYFEAMKDFAKMSFLHFETCLSLTDS